MSPLNTLRIGIFFLAVSYAGAADFESRFYTAPLTVTNTASGSRPVISLTGIENDSVRFRTAEGAEAAFPLSSDALNAQFMATDAQKEAFRSLSGEVTEEQLRTLRPMLYPMFRFLSMDPRRTNIHRLAERYLQYLVESSNPDQHLEAWMLLQGVRLKAVPPAFTHWTLKLVRQMALNNRLSDAQSLIERIPAESAGEELALVLIDVAGELRNRSEWEKAAPLYKKALSLSPENARTLPALWAGYCALRLKNTEEAFAAIRPFATLTPADSAFPLLMLIQGMMALERGLDVEGIRLITRGVVHADISHEWTPELMMVSARCYTRFSKPEVASSIYNEVQLLFRNSVWATRAANELKALSLASAP